MMDRTREEQYLLEIGEKAKHTFWGYLGAELVQADDKVVVASLDIQDKHLNLIGIMHGGVHATLLDSAMGLLAMIAKPGYDVLTSTLTIHFTSPAKRGKVTASAEIIHQSGRMITMQGSLTDEEGVLCSLATASFRIIERVRDS
ncbi:PaaI family thioesterase [Paenibacillus sp. GCM10023252]|uniref:PaaI family thioesterase n=1 Tax=Paenibacillus sp. GCM10023252 TaxID=3252649 RepID=UPI00360FD32E